MTAHQQPGAPDMPPIGAARSDTYNPPPGLEYPFSIGDIAFAIGRRLPESWTAGSGPWGVTGKILGPGGEFALHVDKGGHLIMKCLLPWGQPLPKEACLPDGMRRNGRRPEVYLETASVHDGLDHLARKYAATIRVIARIPAPGTRLDDAPDIDLTRRTRPLSLSDISRAFGLSRTAAQKWHKHSTQAATRNKAPALRAVAEATGTPLDPDVLDSARPQYPVSVVLALGKALGYLNAHGRPTGQGKGKGKWFPARPTIDPATREERHYVNHLAAALGVTNEAVEMGLTRSLLPYLPPDGTDEIGRIYWWPATVHRILERAATRV